MLDFFVAQPGLGFRGQAAPMPTVDIAFDAGTVIPYFVGAPSCAVPGTVAGLAEGHRLHGRLPWAELFPPAIEAARDGVAISPQHARLHAILDPILRRDEEGRRIYGHDRPLELGEAPAMGDLAGTLEVLAREGADAFYRGDLANEMIRCVFEGGGALTAQDLDSYRAEWRTPLRAAFRDTEFVTCPPCSAGGVLIALALRVLDLLGPPDAPGSGRADRAPGRGDARDHPRPRRSVHRRAARRRARRPPPRAPGRSTRPSAAPARAGLR